MYVNSIRVHEPIFGLFSFGCEHVGSKGHRHRHDNADHKPDTPSSTAIDTPPSTAMDTPPSTATNTPSSPAVDTPPSTAMDTPPSTATNTPSSTAIDTPPSPAIDPTEKFIDHNLIRLYDAENTKERRREKLNLMNNLTVAWIAARDDINKLQSDIHPNYVLRACLLAVDFRRTAVENILLESSKQINKDLGDFVLHVAAHCGQGPTVKWLLSKGIKIDRSDAFFGTALIAATFEDHAPVVEILLSNQPRPDVNKKVVAETALRVAARRGSYEVAKLLLHNGAEIDMGIGSPVREAATKGHTNVMWLLIQHGVKLNITFINNRTPLLIAAHNGHCDMVKLLLGLERDDVDVNARDCFERTPLLAATREGHEDVVKLLLDTEGVDVNAVDCRGDTALTLARRRGMVMVLVEL